MTTGQICLFNMSFYVEHGNDLPVLYTWSSSTMPSFPPPNTTMSSLIATALCPCLGRGTGPDHPRTRFQRGWSAEPLVPDKAEPGDVMSSRYRKKSSQNMYYICTPLALSWEKIAEKKVMEKKNNRLANLPKASASQMNKTSASLYHLAG